ncbi:hypothetical protein C2S51_028241 [Perilla frutescens var. frutescens]|nr:hypothetical protein C2S51_028241 [Perilla frutescens var. frutescens]
MTGELKVPLPKAATPSSPAMLLWPARQAMEMKSKKLIELQPKTSILLPTQRLQRRFCWEGFNSPTNSSPEKTTVMTVIL